MIHVLLLICLMHFPVLVKMHWRLSGRVEVKGGEGETWQIGIGTNEMTHDCCG